MIRLSWRAQRLRGPPVTQTDSILEPFKCTVPLYQNLHMSKKTIQEFAPLHCHGKKGSPRQHEVLEAWPEMFASETYQNSGLVRTHLFFSFCFEIQEHFKNGLQQFISTQEFDGKRVCQSSIARDTKHKGCPRQTCAKQLKILAITIYRISKLSTAIPQPFIINSIRRNLRDGPFEQLTLIHMCNGSINSLYRG